MRRYGLLLHISSLPSDWGIGDLGPEAHAFARTLGEAGGSVWQILPLNPTSTFIGNSPYSSFSVFAGNLLFISPEFLLRDGYLSREDLDFSINALQGRALAADPTRVDFEAVTAHRLHILNRAFERSAGKLDQLEAFVRFCREEDHWLHDFARYITLKARFSHASWTAWPGEYRRRETAALEAWDAQARHEILRQKFYQYLFYSQWRELRQTCQEAGVRLLGDVPIYVTHDSADVWSHSRYFNLDAAGEPVSVSGVPPDYFSETGQRWGSPVYRWDVMEKEDFAWWKRRLEHALTTVDMARLDHFRGFTAYWDIPAEEETAVKGKWRPAPSRALFASLKRHFGELPFLAEDLGIITDDVREVMEEFELPGMHVLQFAFGGEDFAQGTNIPHALTRASFVYTGTHDNPPTVEWYQNAEDLEQHHLRVYLGKELDPWQAVRELARLAFASVAECAVLPMQDALFLGPESRMNVPGLASGNWGWRMTKDQAHADRLVWLTEYAAIYDRLPRVPGKRLKTVDDLEPKYGGKGGPAPEIWQG